jgi:hypothetical protein
MWSLAMTLCWLRQARCGGLGLASCRDEVAMQERRRNFERPAQCEILKEKGRWRTACQVQLCEAVQAHNRHQGWRSAAQLIRLV